MDTEDINKCFLNNEARATVQPNGKIKIEFNQPGMHYDTMKALLGRFQIKIGEEKKGSTRSIIINAEALDRYEMHFKNEYQTRVRAADRKARGLPPLTVQITANGVTYRAQSPSIQTALEDINRINGGAVYAKRGGAELADRAYYMQLWAEEFEALDKSGLTENQIRARLPSILEKMIATKAEQISYSEGVLYNLFPERRPREEPRLTQPSVAPQTRIPQVMMYAGRVENPEKHKLTAAQASQIERDLAADQSPEPLRPPPVPPRSSSLPSAQAKVAPPAVQPPVFDPIGQRVTAQTALRGLEERQGRVAPQAPPLVQPPAPDPTANLDAKGRTNYQINELLPGINNNIKYLTTTNYEITGGFRSQVNLNEKLNELISLAKAGNPEWFNEHRDFVNIALKSDFVNNSVKTELRKLSGQPYFDRSIAPNDTFIKAVWQKLLEAEAEHSAPTYQGGNMYGTPGGLNESEKLNTLLQGLRDIDRSLPTPAKKAEAVHLLLKEKRNEKEDLRFMRPADKFVNTVLRDPDYKPLLERQKKDNTKVQPILSQQQVASGKAEQQFKGELASKAAAKEKAKEPEPEKKKKPSRPGNPSAPNFD